MPTFEPQEYLERLDRARHCLAAEALDALLIFSQESHYYLFGYDGGGYVFFQCAVLPLDGRPPVLLCRRPDVAQARDTSLIEDVRVWLNAADQNPAMELKLILQELGFSGKRVGIETDSYGLTGFNYALVQDAMAGFCKLTEASHIVRNLRVVKSAGEVELVRRAGGLADDAVDAVADSAAPGVLDSELTAAAMRAILTGGGDVPPAGPLVNSGERAVYGRGVGGPRRLAEDDQVMIELAGTYKRYNCCIERAVAIGSISDEFARMFDLVRETLLEMLNAFRPGEPLGRIDEIHRQRLDAAGYSASRYAACGYSLGATYRPSWMDVPPMIFVGNTTLMQPGMVFFPHVMLGDVNSRVAVGLGNSVLVTERGHESLTRHPLDLIHRG